MTLTPAQEFHERCALHDWHYQHSDDQSVWRDGCRERAAILATLKASPELHPIYSAWILHIYYNGARPVVPK